MNKNEFIDKLRSYLSPISEEEREKSISYYCEMIEDRIEGGEKEEDVIASLGSAREIANQILVDAPIKTLVKAKIKPKRALRPWEVVLIILGSPIWFSLLIALISVVFAVYITLWSLVVSLYAIMVSFIAAGVGGVGLLFVFLFASEVAKGLVLLGAGLVLCGLGVLLIKPTLLATKGMWKISAGILRFLKRCIIGRGKDK